MIAAVLLIEVLVIYTVGRPLLSSMVGWALSAGTLKRWATWLLLAPGVTLHESAHALVALGLGGQVDRFVPFWPHREPDGVRFGYVIHGGAIGGPLGGAAVGMAPLWMVPLLTYLAGMLLIPGHGSDPAGLLSAAVTHLASPLTWLWFWLTLSSCIGLLPSPTDHRDLPPALAFAAILATLAVLFGISLDLAQISGVLTLLAQLLAVPAVLALAGRALLAVRGG
jgi:hypothetical protein